MVVVCQVYILIYIITLAAFINTYDTTQLAVRKHIHTQTTTTTTNTATAAAAAAPLSPLATKPLRPKP